MIFQIVEIPQDECGLKKSLSEALATMGARDIFMELEGHFPSFTRFDVRAADLDFKRLRSHRMEADAQSEGGGFFVREMRLCMEPICFEGVEATFLFTVRDAVFEAVRLDSYGHGIRLSRMDCGEAEMRFEREVLQRALFKYAATAAEKHGAEVTGLDLDIASESPKILTFRAEVIAKAMFLSTKVTVSGSLHLNEMMEVAVRDLRCDGEGAAGKMAAVFLRSQFDKIQSLRLPLNDLSGGFPVRSVSVDAGSQIVVHAEMGRA